MSLPLVQLQIGMPIMIRGTNDAPMLSIASGVTGIVYDIVFINAVERTDHMTRSQIESYATHSDVTVPIVLMRLNKTHWKPCDEQCANDCDKHHKSVLPNVSRVLPIVPIERAFGQTGFRITQLPLIPADAITEHKLEGITSDAVVVHLPHIKDNFARGMTYTILSRTRNLTDLALTPDSHVHVDTLNETRWIEDTHRVNNELERLHAYALAYDRSLYDRPSTIIDVERFGPSHFAYIIEYVFVAHYISSTHGRYHAPRSPNGRRPNPPRTSSVSIVTYPEKRRCTRSASTERPTPTFSACA